MDVHVNVLWVSFFFFFKTINTLRHGADEFALMIFFFFSPFENPINDQNRTILTTLEYDLKEFFKNKNMLF